MHRRRHWPSPWTKGLGTPDVPAIRFARGTVFGATLVHNCYGLSGCWPPCTDLTGFPANGGFYFQAFSESVVLLAAGYDYNSNWTPLLAGLSPAGMAASLAALARPCTARANDEARHLRARENETKHVRMMIQITRKRRTSLGPTRATLDRADRDDRPPPCRKRRSDTSRCAQATLPNAASLILSQATEDLINVAVTSPRAQTRQTVAKLTPPSDEALCREHSDRRCGDPGPEYNLQGYSRMRARMKRLLVAAILAMSMASTWASAQEARPPISAAQLQKILKFVEEEFPPPTAQNLGISSDPNQALPVTVVVTDNHKVYFCRSELNPADYIIWVRAADNNSSYMFLTHTDLKLVRTLYLKNQASLRCWMSRQRRSRPSIKTPWRRWAKTSIRCTENPG